MTHKNITCRFAVGMVMMILSVSARATDIRSTVSDISGSIGDNISIFDTGALNASNIDVERTIFIENHGFIGGNIYVADNHQLYIHNTGTFAATVHLGENAHITQIIHSASDVTDIKCGANCSVLVRSDDFIPLADLVAIAKNADAIILDNAHIRMGTTEQMPSNVHTIGTCVVKISDNDDTNTVGPGTNGNVLTFSGNGVGTHVSGYDSNTSHRVDFSRATGPVNTRLVDALTASRPDDPLLERLHAATSLDDANRILDRAFRMHPMKLMAVPEMLDRFVLTETIDSGHLIGDVFTVFSGDTFGGGVRAGIGINLGPVRITALGNYAQFRYNDDDVNDFIGTTYGGVGQIGLNLKYMWMDMVGGASSTTFDIGPVLDGTDIKFDPRGKTLYGRGDIGARIPLGDMVFLMPMIGAGVHRSEILDDSDTTVYGRAGGRIGIRTMTDGIGLTGDIRAVYHTDKVITATVNANFTFTEDGFDVGFVGGMYYDPDMHKTSFKISLNGSYTF